MYSFNFLVILTVRLAFIIECVLCANVLFYSCIYCMYVFVKSDLFTVFIILKHQQVSQSALQTRQRKNNTNID